MFGEINQVAGWGQVHRLFFNHIATMPRWHKLVLMVALLMALGGGAGQLLSAAAGGATYKPGTGVVQPPVAPTPASAAHPSDAATDGSTPSYPFIGRISPRATRIGVSLIGGFIVGWLCRAFVKTMTLIILLALGIMLLLSYLGVMNLDFTAARHEYASVMRWVLHQTWLVKNMVVAHLPSSGGATFGAFLGFRRRWSGRAFV